MKVRKGDNKRTKARLNTRSLETKKTKTRIRMDKNTTKKQKFNSLRTVNHYLKLNKYLKNK